MTLDKFYNDPKNDDHLLGIYFQILYTLEVFNRYGLRHNDLHRGNVFVQTTMESKEKEIEIEKTYIEYIVNDVRFFIPSQFMALIYDFDRASVKGFDGNT